MRMGLIELTAEQHAAICADRSIRTEGSTSHCPD